VNIAADHELTGVPATRIRFKMAFKVTALFPLTQLVYRFNTISPRLLRYVTSYGKFVSDYHYFPLQEIVQECIYRVRRELGLYR
jgi:hypothetical protein